MKPKAGYLERSIKINTPPGRKTKKKRGHKLLWEVKQGISLQIPWTLNR